MTAILSPPLIFQGVGFGGEPLPFGYLYSYIAGTATPQATWTDSTQVQQNLNPVKLNVNGQAPVWLDPTLTYKFKLTDALGNQVYTTDQVQGSLTAASLSTSLTQALIGQIFYPQTAAEISAGVTPVNFQYFAQPWLWVRREGCVLDGSTDDTVAFNKCLSVAASTNMSLLIDGPLFLNSNISIAQNVQLLFVGNGKIKVGSGKTITLGQIPQAGLWQIFDTSSGGLIALPTYRSMEVWGEWWGANGSGSVLNNDVPINSALAAIAATGIGGVVRLGAGTFFISAVISMTTLCTLRGMNFYTLIKAQAGWTGGTRMLSATNSTSPMFWSRVEFMRFDAGGIGAITQVIYSTGWQEKCGLFNVYIANFNTAGFYYEHGYGGAAHMQLSNLEVFPNDVAGATGVFMTNDASVGFMKVEITQFTAVDANPWEGNGTISSTTLTINSTSGGAPAIGQLITGVGVTPGTTISSGSGTSWVVNNSQSVGPIAMIGTQDTTGMQLDNQIIGIINGVDVETIRQGILLTHGAVLTGAGMSGGQAVTAMINCGSSWTGQIDCGSVKIGNATAVIVDSNRAYAIAAIESLTGHLTWPPNLGVIVAAAAVTVSAGVAAYAWQQGFSVGTGPNRTGAGSTTMTLATTMDGSSTYGVMATTMDSSAPIIAVNVASATAFAVLTKNASGTPTDSGEFFVQVYHKP